jgi:hypothetical protein
MRLLCFTIVLLISCSSKKPTREIEIEPSEFIKEDSSIKYDCRYTNVTSSLGEGLLLWKFDCYKQVVLYKGQNLLEEYGEYNFCIPNKCPCPFLYSSENRIPDFC